MSTELTKTRTAERTKASNEVFTPHETVEEMLDEIQKIRPELFTNWKKTMLEPYCGNGRFLIAVLRRRLEAWENGEAGSKRWDPCVAVGTLYGIDIHSDNVQETRDGMINVIIEIGLRNGKDDCARSRRTDRICERLSTNIVRGDSFKILGDPDYDDYEFDIDQPDPEAFAMEDEILKRSAMQQEKEDSVDGSLSDVVTWQPANRAVSATA